MQAVMTFQSKAFTGLQKFLKTFGAYNNLCNATKAFGIPVLWFLMKQE